MGMSSTFLSNRGYAICKTGTVENELLLEKLRKELTVKPKLSPAALTGKSEDELTFTLYRESSKKFYVPRWFGIDRFGPPTHDATSSISIHIHDIHMERMKFMGHLRPEQEGPVQSFLHAAHCPELRGGILVLPCAAGKTTMSLYIACSFGKKTLVVCHKEFLMNQWIERIQQFVPTARIGRIQQKIIDVDDKDIVIASLQSIAMRDYQEDLFESFYLSIFDEVHHTGAQVFSRALAKINTSITLGLSATPKRKDGLSKVFEWYLGKPVFEIKRRSDTELIVSVERYYDPHPNYGRELRMFNNQLNFAKMINNITAFEPRNRMIVDKVMHRLQIEPNRQCLILSERRSQLQLLEDLFVECGMDRDKIGYCVGGMTDEQLRRSFAKQILLATYQLVSEGFDVPTLNTMVLASPVSSIEQSIGRIQRQKPSERTYTPWVLDIIDEFSIFRNQGKRRLQFYRKNGYMIDDPLARDDESPSSSSKSTFEFRSDDEEDK